MLGGQAFTTDTRDISQSGCEAVPASQPDFELLMSGLLIELEEGLLAGAIG